MGKPSAWLITFGIILVIALVPVAAFALAPDLESGKRTFQNVCATCHGPMGLSANPLWPNLAGQKIEYLRKQLHAFRDGERYHELMTPQAKLLSTKDIEDVTAYITALKPSP